MHEAVIVGGGLAGSEAAWQAALQGVRITLFEMRQLPGLKPIRPRTGPAKRGTALSGLPYPKLRR